MCLVRMLNEKRVLTSLDQNPVHPARTPVGHRTTGRISGLTFLV